MAFAPQVLDYCLTDPNDPETWECTSPTRHEPFIDGGVFDNNPLRLAARLANFGLRVDDNGLAPTNPLRASQCVVLL